MDLICASPLDICDHGDCPALGDTPVTIGDLELRMCQHHANETHEALARQASAKIAAP